MSWLISCRRGAGDRPYLQDLYDFVPADAECLFRHGIRFDPSQLDAPIGSPLDETVIGFERLLAEIDDRLELQTLQEGQVAFCRDGAAVQLLLGAVIAAEQVGRGGDREMVRRSKHHRISVDGLPVLAERAPVVSDLRVRYERPRQRLTPEWSRGPEGANMTFVCLSKGH